MAPIQSLQPAAFLELNNLVLFIVLILLFVVGYKLMQAVIQTILIAVMSGVFLIALAFTGLGPQLTPSNFILFMVLGVGLYILYSTLNTAKRVITFLWNTASKIIDLAVPDSMGLPSLGGSGNDSEEGTKAKVASDGDSDEKTVILKEVDDDE